VREKDCTATLEHRKGTMIRSLLVVSVAFLTSAHAHENLDITLAHGSKSELQTKAQLQGLLTHYDCANWVFTRQVIIEEGAIPHSHPTLTLNTRHLGRDDLLLSTFLHEQMHWFLSAHESDADAAMNDLRKIYPAAPIGFPEGSADEPGNYEHLLVVYLEYKADQELLGKAGARKVMDFWAQDHYKWIYSTVLKDETTIARVLLKYKLYPSSIDRPKLFSRAWSPQR
jgi:hypothetical protein